MKGVNANVCEKLVNGTIRFVCDGYQCDDFRITRRFGRIRHGKTKNHGGSVER